MITLFDQETASAPLVRSSLVPRDYQSTAIQSAFDGWGAGHVGSLVRIPTGTGKTIVGALIAEEWLARDERNRVLVLAHERQLIQQFSQEIEDVLRIRPAIEMAGRHCFGAEKIIVGSRQTLYVKGDDQPVSRLYKFRPEFNWLLIVDEAHRWTRNMSSCKPIIEWFEQNPNHRRLGLTATPERTDKKTFQSLFSHVAIDYRLFDHSGGPSAVNDGWSVPYDQRYITVEGVDFKNIKEVARDFDKHELEAILGQQETLAKLCKPMLDLVGRRRTLIFSPGTEMAKNVALYLNAEAGHRAAMTIDGSYPDVLRQEIYRQHQSGEFQFLSVCGLCREGYNDPDIGAVAIFRPTKSRSLAEQMKGRGCRPMRGVVSSEMSPDERRRAIAASDKPACMIIDLVGCTGLGDVPSTVDIIAASLPDEVRDRANRKLLEQSNEYAGDVIRAVREAETEVVEEKRVAREAALAREQAEANRRAALKAQVNYTATQVKSGQVGSANVKRHVDPPTDNQCKLLRLLGVEHPQAMSARQAKGALASLLNRRGGDYVVRGGPHRGKSLRDVPVEWLRQEAKRRTSDSQWDRDFQTNVEMYRREWLATHRGQQ